MCDINKFLALVSENQSDWIGKAIQRQKNEKVLNNIAEKTIYLLRKMRKHNITKHDLSSALNIPVISYPIDCDKIIEYLDKNFD